MKFSGMNMVLNIQPRKPAGGCTPAGFVSVLIKQFFIDCNAIYKKLAIRACKRIFHGWHIQKQRRMLR
ncbi:hypothetical protein [Anaerotruncus colihominis]|uniref:hypothetical protein n=1 Tax=Anaerotruncus colihominis TaxID=169435 RepID=UPI001362CE37|nr:hypothetical protein [Anaerotruncus colihominis]